MAIHFDLDRMEAARNAHAQWWNGTLDRPLACLTVQDAYPCAHTAKAPLLQQSNCTDFSWSAEELIDAMDAELSRKEYLGDAYPYINLDSLGPGVLSAFCGAKLDNSSGGVWFFPQKEMEIADIHVTYDPNSIWVKRIKDIYRAGFAKWGGLVAIGMPDLGGVMDVSAIFRGSENLLMDLFDEPEEVLRLNGEVQAAWHSAYEDLSAFMQECGAPGSTDWSSLLSTTPSYIIQCDFSYMISNEMFKEFALPFLRTDTEWLDHTIYHLDGIGELKHLDDLLALPKLNAVQWVFGAGQPSAINWLDVYHKIAAAGKNMLVEGSVAELVEVMPHLKGVKGICLHPSVTMAERDGAIALLNMR